MSKLLQLLIDNRRIDGKARSRVQAAAAGSSDETVIYLYDPIVGSRALAEWLGYVCAQDLVPDIDGMQSGTLRLRINCPGGDVFAMQAIMASIRNARTRGVKVIAQIDSVCASAATGIASVCDEVIMEPGSLYMVHNSQGMAMGDRNELRDLANLMEKVDGNLADAYVEKSGAKKDQVIVWMDAETWFNADEAVAHGFADTKGSSTKKVNAANEWKLSAFKNAPQPDPAEPAPAPPVQSPAPPEPATITAEARERLGQRLRVVAAAQPIHVCA